MVSATSKTATHIKTLNLNSRSVGVLSVRMSSPPVYTPSTANVSRTMERNQPSVFRNDQRFVELHASSDLSRSCVLRLLPPLNTRKSDSHTVCVIGDSASMDDEQLLKQQTSMKHGILRAIYRLDAYLVDNGLGSSVAVLCDDGANNTSSDFSRDILHIGISPRCDDLVKSAVSHPLSQYTTHQIVLHDFKNWNDRPSEFVSEKFKFIR